MSKEPWLTFGWTKTQYFQFIRSALRRAFMRYPAGYKAMEPYTRIVDVLQKNGKIKKQKEVECQMCKGWFKPSHVQMDHVTPCGSLKGYEDFEPFVSTLFCGTDNLAPLCKETCHPIKTLADKNGISITEAETLKEIIRICKLPTKEIIDYCKQHGYNAQQLSNAEKRKQAVTAILKGKK